MSLHLHVLIRLLSILYFAEGKSKGILQFFAVHIVFLCHCFFSRIKILSHKVCVPVKLPRIQYSLLSACSFVSPSSSILL